ncbi:hypothetical protein [Shewanella algae]|uniref:hypothetical protein n=1 Tax=Shewanella algae TaxID=38313 RepID=UPI0031F4B0A7
MTLIFAKKSPDGISIVSDTKLNYTLESELPLHSEYQKNGAIKLFTVNNQKFLIACSGLDYKISEALNSLKGIEKSKEKILNTLLETNIQSNNENDFLFCCADTNEIFKISDSAINTPEYCYIGDFYAYKIFSQRINHDSSISELEFAMNFVIQDRSEETKTVGGMCISAKQDGNKFKFKNQFSNYIEHKDLIIGTEPTNIPIYSTPAGGTYSVYINGNDNGSIIYFYEAKLALYYKPLSIKPEVFSNIEQEQLKERFSHLGLSPSIVISATSQTTNSIEFLYKILNQKQYSHCLLELERFDKSKLTPTQEYQVDYLEGVCLLNLGIKNLSKSTDLAKEYLRKSVDRFHHITKKHGEFIETLEQMGIALSALGHTKKVPTERFSTFKRAVDTLSKAIELDPNKSILHHNKAAALFELIPFSTSKVDLHRVCNEIISLCEKALTINKEQKMSEALLNHAKKIYELNQ